MKVLTKKEIIDEYKDLITKEKISKEEALDKILNSDDYLLSESNGISVFMGSYRWERPEDDFYPVETFLVDDEDSTITYKYFYEIDRCWTMYKKPEDMEDFEKNHIIIYIPNARNFQADFTYLEDFKKLRKIYFRELFNNGEEEAIKYITSEENIKSIFSVENYMKENNIDPVFFQAFNEVALCNKKSDKVLVKTLGSKPSSNK